ncbi:hypothetical protein [Halorientalis regularis]|uniref:Uncharacterized protein n=1 Tax=Halorientalis regularis TaxID=660518 RepID=A0A1G7SKM1_9EURY|nr:hypothetical protein [Halorientalis regularis]SDG23553.1 hypothetical protein SAMN05216218_11911 [Halorientalis regularis]
MEVDINVSLDETEAQLPLMKPIDVPDGGLPREKFPDALDTAEVGFTPQIPDNGYLYAGDEITFEVPIEDVFDEDGLIPDCCEASDQLREHENAPRKAKQYPFPFYVTINRLFNSKTN